MRRLLTALLTCGVVAAGLSAVAEPVSASAPTPPRFGYGPLLPEAPMSGVIVDAALDGQRAWSVVEVVNAERERVRSLWSTPANGWGSWTQHAGPDGVSDVRTIESAGGGMVTATIGPEGAPAIIGPESARWLTGRAVLEVGGRLIAVRDDTSSTTRIEDVSGRPLLEIPAPASVDRGRVWWTQEGELRSRDLLDGGDDSVLTLAEAQACPEGTPRVRGRWAILACADHDELLDLTGGLDTEVLRAGDLELGHDLVVVRLPEGRVRVIDPVTMESTGLPMTRTAVPDAADTPHVLAHPGGPYQEVFPIEGLGGDPSDLKAPAVTFAPIPTALDGQGVDEEGRTVTIAWSALTEAGRVEIEAGGERRRLPRAVTSTQVRFHPADARPCVRTRAVDRAGNPQPWRERCLAWDREAPRPGRVSVGRSHSAGYQAMGNRHDHPATDDVGVAKYQHRWRLSDRRGTLGAWRRPYITERSYTSAGTRSGLRMCTQARGIDALHRFYDWSQTRWACSTKQYTPLSWTVRSDRMGGFRHREAHEGFASILREGTSMRTKEALLGRGVLVVHVWRAPRQGILDVYRDGRRIRAVPLAAAGEGRWQWIHLPHVVKPEGSKITFKARAGNVRMDLFGMRRAGDLYPPAP